MTLFDNITDFMNRTFKNEKGQYKKKQVALGATSAAIGTTALYFLTKRIYFKTQRKWSNYTTGLKINTMRHKIKNDTSLVLCLHFFAKTQKKKQKTKNVCNNMQADEALADVNLENLYAIVTGCNTGLGKETVRAMLNRGVFSQHYTL